MHHQQQYANIMLNNTHPYFEESEEKVKCINGDRYGNVFLDVGKWHKYNISEFLQSVKQWNIRTALFLGYNQQKYILKHFKAVQLKYLRVLSLEGNNIQSLQGIHSLALKSLRTFDMNQNNIHDLSELRKVRMLLLQSISLQNNPINNFEHLTKLSSQQLRKITYCEDQLLNVRWIFKIQSNRINESNYPQSLSNQMSQRFPSLLNM